MRVVRAPHVFAPGSTGKGQHVGHRAGRRPAPQDRRGRLRARRHRRADRRSAVDVQGSSRRAVRRPRPARVVASAARVALAVTPERADLDIGEPAAFAVRGFGAVDGRPGGGARSALAPRARPLRARAAAHAGRRRPRARRLSQRRTGHEPRVRAGGRRRQAAIDVGAVTVAPQALLGSRARRSAEVQIATDKPRYRVGEKLRVSASLAGAAGDAFVDFEGARAMGEQTLPAPGGRRTRRSPPRKPSATPRWASRSCATARWSTPRSAWRSTGPATRARPRSPPTAVVRAGRRRARHDRRRRPPSRCDARDSPRRCARVERRVVRRRGGGARRNRHDHAEPGVVRSRLARIRRCPRARPALDLSGNERSPPAPESLGAHFGARAAVADRPRRPGRLRPGAAAGAGPLRGVRSQSLRRRRRRRGDARDRGALMCQTELTIASAAPADVRAPGCGAPDAARHVRPGVPRVLRAARSHDDARRAHQRGVRLHDDDEQDHFWMKSRRM